MKAFHSILVYGIIMTVVLAFLSVFLILYSQPTPPVIIEVYGSDYAETIGEETYRRFTSVGFVTNEQGQTLVDYEILFTLEQDGETVYEYVCVPPWNGSRGYRIDLQIPFSELPVREEAVMDLESHFLVLDAETPWTPLGFIGELLVIAAIGSLVATPVLAFRVRRAAKRA